MKTSKAFFYRLLTIFAWLIENSFDISDPVDVFFYRARFDGIQLEGDFYFMQLKEGQKVTVSAELRTRAGNAADYEAGSVSWETSNPNAAKVTVNPENELEATITGVNGSANDSVVITFRADGDPDADESREIIGTVDVVVTKGEAVVVELKTGTPSDVDGGGKSDTDGNTEAGESPETVEPSAPDSAETPNTAE